MKKTNDFICDTSHNQERITIPQKTILICLIFTGLCAVQATVYITQWILWSAWNYIGLAKFIYNVTWNIAILIFFFTILFLYWSHKPFHIILSKGIYIIGILFITVALIIPRISETGYVPSGISFIQLNNFILADAVYMILGVICLLLGSLFRTGYQLQNEVDNIL